MNNFYEALNPGGYLFIGHSESLTSICDRFETVEVGGVFLYRKPRPRRYVTFDEVVAQRRRDSREATGKPPRPVGAVPPVSSAPGSSAAASAVSIGPRATERVDEFVGEAYPLLEEGRPLEARQAADCALAIDPSSIEALIVRAYTHADDGDLDAAIDEARRVLEIDPLVASAHYILGLIYQRQGDQDAGPGCVLAHDRGRPRLRAGAFQPRQPLQVAGDARRGVPRIPQHFERDGGQRGGSLDGVSRRFQARPAGPDVRAQSDRV